MNAHTMAKGGPRCRPLLPLLFTGLMALAVAGCGGGDSIAPPALASEAPPSSVLTLAVQDIKTLRFNWTDTGQETGYRLLVETHGSGTRTPVATLPANTLQHDLPVFLPEQINARYTLQACNAAGCLDAATTTVETALLKSAIGYFKAAQPVARLGTSVALSADGRTLAVGAPLEDSMAEDSGAVHVFTRGATGWAPQAVVHAPSPAFGDRFGEALALTSDGLKLAVGAPGFASHRGAVFVFAFDNGQWMQDSLLEDPTDPTTDDGRQDFGWAVDLADDGNTLMAGWKYGGASAVVFARDGGPWASQSIFMSATEFDESPFAITDCP